MLTAAPSLLILASKAAHAERVQAANDILFWLAVAIIASTLIVIAGVWLYRRISRDDGSAHDGFSLSELRRMHAEGRLSDEEYEKAKLMVIATNPMLASVLSDDESDEADDGGDAGSHNRSI